MVSLFLIYYGCCICVFSSVFIIVAVLIILVYVNLYLTKLWLVQLQPNQRRYIQQDIFPRKSWINYILFLAFFNFPNPLPYYLYWLYWFPASPTNTNSPETFQTHCLQVHTQDCLGGNIIFLLDLSVLQVINQWNQTCFYIQHLHCWWGWEMFLPVKF